MSEMSEREKAFVCIIYGLEKGLWDLMGEGCLAVASLIGEGMIEQMGRLAKIDIYSIGEEEAFKEIDRVLVEDMDIARSFSISRDKDIITIEVEGCTLLEVQKDLIQQGIKPFICPFMNLVACIIRKRGNSLTKIEDINVDIENKKCVLKFKEYK